MRIQLSRNRQRGNLLLGILYLVLVLIIGGIGIWIILKIWKKLPPILPPKGGDTNELVQVHADIPASDLTNHVYRIVLQRSIDGTNWDDITGVDYSGQSTTLDVVTNWTDFGLFRAKAYKVR